MAEVKRQWLSSCRCQQFTIQTFKQHIAIIHASISPLAISQCVEVCGAWRPILQNASKQYSVGY
jgi:hypothetical protein